MTRLLAVLPLLFLSGAVFGKTFECTEALATAFEALSDEKAPVLVIATVNADGKTGTIEVADRTFEAEYQVEGLDRTWRFFTGEGQEYGYLFLIQPDGTSAYYDHETSEGEATSSDQVYFCRDQELATEVDGPKKAADPEALGDYIAQIRQKIYRNWKVPASAQDDLFCSVRVRQARGGEVLGMSFVRCNGDDAVKRSIEAAIVRSSPLPEPPEPDLFDPNILLNLAKQ